MSQKRSYNQYPPEFKEEAAALVTEQGYSVPGGCEFLGIATNMLYRWKEKRVRITSSVSQNPAHGERDFKKGFIDDHCQSYPVRLLCRVMNVSKSAFYAWKARPAKVITAEELHLYRRIKVLFDASRSSLGSRELAKKLNEEGIQVSRHRVRMVMQQLGLKVTQRVAYKVTTRRKHSDRVAYNLLNQQVNPVGKDQVWAGDVTYLKTGEGWMYLAIVMDLYSRRIVGWAIDKRMTTSLISRALIKAYNLRQPPKGLVFHSDRGSQYTSRHALT
jgi:putative transposase